MKCLVGVWPIMGPSLPNAITPQYANSQVTANPEVYSIEDRPDPVNGAPCLTLHLGMLVGTPLPVMCEQAAQFAERLGLALVVFDANDMHFNIYPDGTGFAISVGRQAADWSRQYGLRYRP